MKPLPAIAAGMLAAFLLLSPAIVTAAAPTVTTNATAYSGSQTITISGTTTASATVGLKVTNPSGTTVFIDNVVADSTGAYTDSFAAGGSSNWVTGTYTVTATVSSTSGTTTFTYTATAPAPTGNQFTVLASATNPLLAGQQAQIMAFVYWANGTAAKSAVTVTAQVTDPSGTQTAATAGAFIANGVWAWTDSSTSASGSYLAVITAKSGSAWGYGSAGFSVNSGLATAANQATTQSALATLQKDLSANFTALTTAITSVKTAVTAAQTAITAAITSATSGLATAANLATLQNSVNSITTSLTAITSAANTAATNAATAAQAAQAASSAVSNNQTYVLVVAALAAIVLVLELAILVRKVS